MRRRAAVPTRPGAADHGRERESVGWPVVVRSHGSWSASARVRRLIAACRHPCVCAAVARGHESRLHGRVHHVPPEVLQGVGGRVGHPLRAMRRMRTGDVPRGLHAAAGARAHASRAPRGRSKRRRMRACAFRARLAQRGSSTRMAMPTGPRTVVAARAMAKAGEMPGTATGTAEAADAAEPAATAVALRPTGSGAADTGHRGPDAPHGHG